MSAVGTWIRASTSAGIGGTPSRGMSVRSAADSSGEPEGVDEHQPVDTAAVPCSEAGGDRAAEHAIAPRRTNDPRRPGVVGWGELCRGARVS